MWRCFVCKLGVFGAAVCFVHDECLTVAVTGDAAGGRQRFRGNATFPRKRRGAETSGCHSPRDSGYDRASPPRPYVSADNWWAQRPGAAGR